MILLRWGGLYYGKLMDKDSEPIILFSGGRNELPVYLNYVKTLRFFINE